MIIGIPKEIKADENRVGMTPAAAGELVLEGHELVVETNAGAGSGFTDAAYAAEGAEIAKSAAAVWAHADLIVKIKEPLEGELDCSGPNQAVFTYFHLAGSEEVTQRVLDAGITAIAYETVTDDQGGLPLLQPMSRIAGELAVQYGANFLTSPFHGCGKLLSKNPGAQSVKVVVIGGGVVGMAAAKRAAAVGADVVVLEKSNPTIQRLASMNEFGNIRFKLSSANSIHEALQDADLVVTAVLSCGAKAPILIRQADLALMTAGGVVVDVAIDQGGCVEGATVTTHSSPTIQMGPVQYYGVANIPGSVPHTSTEALTAATLEYIKAMANDGIEEAVKADPHLANGVNAWQGKLTNKAVAEAHGLSAISLSNAMAPAAEYACSYVGC